jgi:peptide/nickel transport system permease protein
MLLGITFVTFVVIDRAPVDRAELEVARAAPERAFTDVRSRDLAVLRLRVQHGMVDPATLEPEPVVDRYLAWLGNAVRLRFGGPNDDHAALLARIGAALPVTALLGALTLLVAFGAGIPVGVRLGLRAGSRADRAASTVLLAAAALPEFLVGTLLVLALCSAWLQWLPANGLRTPGSEELVLAEQLADLAWHLVLPVTVLALGPTALVVRFVRDAVARAAKAPFAAALHALGAPAHVVRARLVRHGCVPVATLAGSLLPLLVSGSIVVENLFGLDGLGHLAFTACEQLDQPMVMALVVLGSTATMAGYALSDWLHRAVDPRVRLS